jgi:carbamoyltransferase
MRIYPDGSIWLDMDYFNYCQGLTMTGTKFHELFGGPPRSPETDLTQHHMDLAASVQAVTEEVMAKLCAHARDLTGSRNLCLAGGVALNCVANGKLLASGEFDEIFIQPAAGDAGGALGAASFCWHQLLDKPRTPVQPDSQRGSLLGPRFTAEQIEAFLQDAGASYERKSDEASVVDAVADAIASDQVVGWFQGRMEFGPRALGCRSIIGDARSPRMQSIMNRKIKFRESFRPFAPCVLRESVSDYFDFPSDKESPYMLLVAPVHPDKRRRLSADEEAALGGDDLRARVNVERSEVPAITHVDYSARVQTVDAERHGRYHKLIERFAEKTGCPVIINTSFNVRGEPIVCTPANAYHCFMHTDMDVLVLEDFILYKDKQDLPDEADRERYRQEFPLD